MKMKITIGIAVLAVVVTAFLFAGNWLKKPKKDDVMIFLQTFKENLASRPPAELLPLFDVRQSDKELVKLLRALSGATSADGRKAEVSIVLNVGDADIQIVGGEFAAVTIPLKFLNPELKPYKSKLGMRLHKVSDGQYRIVAIDANDFLMDLFAYENVLRTSRFKEEDIYGPATLAAFKVAEKLKATYDSVVWFAHVDGQVYYYVATGNWSDQEYDGGEDAAPKMGLVNPVLKEIIPPEFTLIHTIGATLAGLVEVEKDGKKGFYDLRGKVVVPVIHDQVFPTNDGQHLAALRIAGDYFWLNNDTTISNADPLIKIADVLKKTKLYNGGYSFTEADLPVVTELNSRMIHAAVYIPPSYLADLGFAERIQYFKNPLRKNVEFYDVNSSSDVGPVEEGKDSWYSYIYHAIRNHYIGGRSEFYDSQHVVVVDSRRNRAYSHRFYTESDVPSAAGNCTDHAFRALSDTLYEARMFEFLGMRLPDGTTVEQIPKYYYLGLNGDKLRELTTSRNFASTKYVKMDDSYLEGCWEINEKGTHKPSAEVIAYMKMEIYADYGYKFPDKKWTTFFNEQWGDYKAEYESIENKLTDIDRYNINWLDQKLARLKGRKIAYMNGRR